MGPFLTRVVLTGFLLLAAGRIATAADGSPMTFAAGGNDTRFCDCAFIQASGTITRDTPEQFLAFLERNEIHPERVRLNSEGGNLLAGLRLGEIFRSLNFATEVGSDEAVCEGNCRTGGAESYPYFGERASVRKPGTCASACAYAFLGGAERVFESPSKLGFHRFGLGSAASQPIPETFAGAVLDDAQKRTASLLLYVLRMGVDSRVVALASESGPSEMYWISEEEALNLKVKYEPDVWQPWRLETRDGGVVAVSSTFDGVSVMETYCVGDGGAVVDLTDRALDWDLAGWFEQGRTCPFDGEHPVFGERVPPEDVEVISRGEGVATIRFQLGTRDPKLSTPALFDIRGDAYPFACSSLRFFGSTENFDAAVRVAMMACLQN